MVDRIVIDDSVDFPRLGLRYVRGLEIRLHRTRLSASMSSSLWSSVLSISTPMHLLPYSFTAPGLAFGGVPAPYPLTRPYIHFSVAVLSVMTKALPANKATRQAGVKSSKIGYGYLTDRSSTRSATQPGKRPERSYDRRMKRRRTIRFACSSVQPRTSTRRRECCSHPWLVVR